MLDLLGRPAARKLLAETNPAITAEIPDESCASHLKDVFAPCICADENMEECEKIQHTFNIHTSIQELIRQDVRCVMTDHSLSSPPTNSQFGKPRIPHESPHMNTSLSQRTEAVDRFSFIQTRWRPPRNLITYQSDISSHVIRDCYRRRQDQDPKNASTSTQRYESREFRCTHKVN